MLVKGAPVMWKLDVLLYVSLDKLLNEQWICWLFETVTVMPIVLLLIDDIF